ncbi:hypothetical protein [Leptodesmis sichuanensis]|uniref:hypothetical protein n=1 Tax=Leptodesmis sichuanensis TaxID=2906798 RepID=UPI001F3D0D88|nr:hypothetical protein [Leptodesmis sichuanensis]UIE36032.1 hypothetical protein KIK02_13130 [Leptodesmis sichuanensis A121]
MDSRSFSKDFKEEFKQIREIQQTFEDWQKSPCSHLKGVGQAVMINEYQGGSRYFTQTLSYEVATLAAFSY